MALQSFRRTTAAVLAENLRQMLDAGRSGPHLQSTKKRTPAGPSRRQALDIVRGYAAGLHMPYRAASF